MFQHNYKFFVVSFSQNANFHLMISRRLLCRKSTKFEKYQKYQNLVSVVLAFGASILVSCIVESIQFTFCLTIWFIFCSIASILQNMIVLNSLLISNWPKASCFPLVSSDQQNSEVNKYHVYITIRAKKNDDCQCKPLLVLCKILCIISWTCIWICWTLYHNTKTYIYKHISYVSTSSKTKQTKVS